MFRPQAADGLLLYNGNRNDGKDCLLDHDSDDYNDGDEYVLNSGTGDWLALLLRDGHVEFSFDLGSGPTTVRYHCQEHDQRLLAKHLGLSIEFVVTDIHHFSLLWPRVPDSVVCHENMMETCLTYLCNACLNQTQFSPGLTLKLGLKHSKLHILHFQKQLQSCPWLLAQCHCHQVQTIPSFFSLLTKMFVDNDNDHHNHRHRHSSAGDDKADL